MEKVKTRIFYCWNRLLSFCWAFCFIIIGARGFGKTYRCKKHVVKDYLYNDAKFIWLRDTDAAIEELSANDGKAFFDDIFTNEERFKGVTGKIEGRNIIINGKQAGLIMPVRSFHKYKGNSFESYTNIVFDEFIPENQQQYIGDRALQFINTISTIGRTRKNFRVFMTANAIDKGDPILEMLGLNINKGFGYYTNKKKGVVLHYAENSEEFNKKNVESNAGRLASDTKYSANLLNNEFAVNDSFLFTKRKACDIIGIYYNKLNEAVRIYRAKDGSEYYACKDLSTTGYNYLRYVFDVSQVTEDKQLVGRDVLQFLTDLMASKMLLFESRYIQKVFLSIVKGG